MTTDSRTRIMEQDTLKTSVYSTSDVSNETYAWIQDPITRQTLDTTRSSLIDGIYVRTTPPPIIVNQEPRTDIESELAEMAADPEIQREYGLINTEFAETEWDGLADDQ